MRIAPYEPPPLCPWCGTGRLEVIEETPDPNFGALGVSSRTLRCNAPACGRLTEA